MGSKISSRRSNNTLHWNEFLQQKWNENAGENFEEELPRIFRHFLRLKEREPIDIIKWCELVPCEYWNYSKNNVLHFLTSQQECPNKYRLLNHLISTGQHDVNQKNLAGRNPLMIAIEQQDAKIAELLIKSGSNLDNTSYHRNFGPLHLAAKVGNFEVIEVIVNCSADVNALDEDLNSPLHILVMQERDEESPELRSTAKLFVKFGVDVDQINSNGNRPLHLAILNSYFGIAAVLLSAGADGSVEGEASRTPLQLALQAKRFELVEQMVANGSIDPNTSVGTEPTPLIICAVKNVNFNLTEALIKKGVDIDTVDSDGFSSLYHAVKKHDYWITKLLLESGASTNSLFRPEIDPLYEAVISCNDGLCRLLLKSLPISNAFLALSVPLVNCRLNELAEMLKNGIDVTAKDSSGFGIIHVVTTYNLQGLSDRNRARLLEYFIFRGADVDLLESEIDESLHLLSAHARDTSVLSFVERHVDSPYCKNMSSRKFLELVLHVAKNRRRGVIEYICEKRELNSDEIEEITDILIAQQDENIALSFADCYLKSSYWRDITPGRYLELLQATVLHNKFELFEYIRERGSSDVLATHQSELLYNSINAGNGYVLDYFLSLGLDVNHELKENGSTLLQTAIEKEHLNCIRVLLSFNADINRKDAKGNLPIKAAFNHEHTIRDSLFYITRHIVILEILGKPVDKSYFQIIHSHEHLDEFYKACKLEVELMQESWIQDRLTLFDILVRKSDCIHDPVIIDALADENVLDRFSSYKVPLIEKFRRIRERSILTEKAEPILMRLLKCDPNRTFPLVADNIFKHLSRRDLYNLASVSMNSRQNVAIFSNNDGTFPTWKRPLEDMAPSKLYDWIRDSMGHIIREFSNPWSNENMKTFFESLNWSEE